jgi:glycosyltransferase involved in cell wall biosynthesis
MYGGVMAHAVATVSDRIPVVVSLCGDDILGTVGRWPVAAVRSWINRTASIKACKMADGVVAKSENLARAIAPFVDHSKVKVIPNGIDLDRFRPIERTLCLRRLGWSADSFHILFPLNGDPTVKRLRLAEQSAHLARKLGIPVEFHALQNISHDEVPLWLNASDVLLLTSIHEGSPNIVKEGLACNIPIVSVDVGDVVERIRGIDGCHIVSADPRSIAICLQTVASRRLRIHGRPQVLHLSLSKIADKLRLFYVLVLERKQARGNRLGVECLRG